MHCPFAMADPEIGDMSKNDDRNMLLGCLRCFVGTVRLLSQIVHGASLLGCHFMLVQTPASLEEKKKMSLRSVKIKSPMPRFSIVAPF